MPINSRKRGTYEYERSYLGAAEGDLGEDGIQR